MWATFLALKSMHNLMDSANTLVGRARGRACHFFCIILGFVLYHNVTRISLPNILQYHTNSQTQHPKWIRISSIYWKMENPWLKFEKYETWSKAFLCFWYYQNTWWDRKGHQKMTHIDNGPGPGWNYRETAVFTICRKAENGPKIRF